MKNIFECKSAKEVKLLFIENKNLKKYKSIFNAFISTLPRILHDKKKAAISVRSSKYGIHLKIDYINWGSSYSSYISFEDFDSGDTDFVFEIMKAEIEAML